MYRALRWLCTWQILLFGARARVVRFVLYPEFVVWCDGCVHDNSGAVRAEALNHRGYPQTCRVLCSCVATAARVPCFGFRWIKHKHRPVFLHASHLVFTPIRNLLGAERSGLAMPSLRAGNPTAGLTPPLRPRQLFTNYC